MKSLTQSLKNRDIVLNLAEVKGPVMDKLIKMNFEDHLLGGHIFFHASDAIKQLAPSAS